MANVAKRFHWADYLVFAATLIISAAIGVYYRFTGNRQQTTKEFLLGGKKMHPFPVALSLQASFMSAVFILGTPAEIYINGTMYAYIFFGYFICFPLTAHIFVPMFHKLELTSAYEYLERRFNKVIRLLGTVTFTIMMVLYMAIVLYAPALAFSQVTGLSMWVSILGIGAVCTFYTTLGGLKAVVVTDAFQMIVIGVGLLTLLFLGLNKTGGMSNAWRIANEGGRLQWDEIGGDPTIRHSVWTQIIGGAVMVLSLYAANQAMIQRYLSIGRCRDAQIAVYISLLTTAGALVLVVLLGLVMYAYYKDCDPLANNQVKKGDQLIPYFVMDILGHLHGLPGLFMACTFSAALSTVSSGVNSQAAVILVDIIKPIYKFIRNQEMSESPATTISKVLAVLFGIITVGMAYVTSVMGSMVLQLALSIFGLVGGPLLGVMCLGMLFPCTNSWGAGCGIVTSLVLAFWMKVGNILNRLPPKFTLERKTDGCIPENITDFTMFTTEATTWTSEMTFVSNATEDPSTPEVVSDLVRFYNVSYMWYSLITFAVCIIVGLLVTYITECGKRKPTDPNLLYPYSTSCCCCLPSSRRHRFEYEPDYRYKVKETTEVVEVGDDYVNKEMEMKTDDSILYIEAVEEHKGGIVNLSYKKTEEDEAMPSYKKTEEDEVVPSYQKTDEDEAMPSYQKTEEDEIVPSYQNTDEDEVLPSYQKTDEAVPEYARL